MMYLLEVRVSPGVFEEICGSVLPLPQVGAGSEEIALGRALEAAGPVRPMSDPASRRAYHVVLGVPAAVALQGLLWERIGAWEGWDMVDGGPGLVRGGRRVLREVGDFLEEVGRERPRIMESLDRLEADQAGLAGEAEERRAILAALDRAGV